MHYLISSMIFTSSSLSWFPKARFPDPKETCPLPSGRSDTEVRYDDCAGTPQI